MLDYSTSLLGLEVNLHLNEVFWKLATFDRDGLFGVEFPVEYEIAHLELAHTYPVWIARFVRVEDFEAKYTVGGHRFLCAALLVELWTTLIDRFGCCCC